MTSIYLLTTGQGIPTNLAATLIPKSFSSFDREPQVEYGLFEQYAGGKIKHYKNGRILAIMTMQQFSEFGNWVRTRTQGSQNVDYYQTPEKALEDLDDRSYTAAFIDADLCIEQNINIEEFLQALRKNGE